MIFSDAGPDIRWVGNESGYCGETFWSTIDDSKLVIGNSETKYLNTGDPDGNKWIIGQCDVSIRPGWFYHANENDKVKSAAGLTEIYYNSVGRNGVLLINIPPDSLGRLNPTDSTNLVQFKTIIDETFEVNLAAQGKVTASISFSSDKCYSPSNITDDNNESFWAGDKNINSAVIEIQLAKTVTFDRIMIQEPIKFGQRVSEFEISALVNGEWKTLSKGTTIGYKRLLKCEKVSASKLKLSILNANNSPAISNFGLFLASEREH
jgi:alpha-L-fucosidase